MSPRLPCGGSGRGRLPAGELALLVGEPGLGKSTLALDLAARVTRGDLDGDLRGAPRTVVIVSAEDSPQHTIIPRLEAGGADCERCRILRVSVDRVEDIMTLPADAPELQRQVGDIEAALLIVDPVSAHLGAGIDSHRDASIRRALAPLSRLAQETGAAVLGVGHLNKSQAHDIFRRTGGSIGMTAAARSILLLARPTDSSDDTPERLLMSAKANLARLAPALRLRVEGREVTAPDGTSIRTSGLEWCGEAPGVTVAGVLGETDPAAERTARQEAVAWLRDELAEGARASRELRREAEEAGIAWRTLRRARQDVGAQHRKEGAPGETGQRWVWYLPTAVVDDHSPEVDQPQGSGQVRAVPSAVSAETAHLSGDSSACPKSANPEVGQPLLATFEGPFPWR